MPASELPVLLLEPTPSRRRVTINPTPQPDTHSDEAPASPTPSTSSDEAYPTRGRPTSSHSEESYLTRRGGGYSYRHSPPQTYLNLGHPHSPPHTPSNLHPNSPPRTNANLHPQAYHAAHPRPRRASRTEREDPLEAFISSARHFSTVSLAAKSALDSLVPSLHSGMERESSAAETADSALDASFAANARDQATRKAHYECVQVAQALELGYESNTWRTAMFNYLKATHAKTRSLEAWIAARRDVEDALERWVAEMRENTGLLGEKLEMEKVVVAPIEGALRRLVGARDLYVASLEGGAGDGGRVERGGRGDRGERGARDGEGEGSRGPERRDSGRGGEGVGAGGGDGLPPEARWRMLLVELEGRLSGVERGPGADKTADANPEDSGVPHGAGSTEVPEETGVDKSVEDVVTAHSEGEA